VEKHVLENSRISAHEVAKMLGFVFLSVQSILKDGLNICWLATKFMPLLLSEEQQENHANICIQDRLERVPEFLCKIVTCDLHSFMSKTQISSKSHQWKTPIIFTPKKGKSS
jgi:hypothetical protein